MFLNEEDATYTVTECKRVLNGHKLLNKLIIDKSP